MSEHSKVSSEIYNVGTKRHDNAVANPVPRAYVSFGQHQERHVGSVGTRLRCRIML